MKFLKFGLVLVLCISCSKDDEKTKTHTGDIKWTSQSQIDDFGAKNYNVIEGDVFISGFTDVQNEITSFLPLMGLKKIKGNLTIRFISVENLEGLNELERIEGELYITDNYIADFCALSNLVNSNGVTEDFYISDNFLFNPSKEDIQSGNCKLEDVPMKPDFKVSTQEAFVGDKIVFKNTSMGPYSSLLWKFENGIPATSEEQTWPFFVRFLTEGTHNVSLTVSNPEDEVENTYPDFIKISHDPDLVAFYPFESGTNDETPFQNNAVNNGGAEPGYGNYYFGKGYIQTHMLIPDANHLDITDELSIAIEYSSDYGNILRPMLIKNAIGNSDRIPYGLYNDHLQEIFFRMSFENHPMPFEISSYTSNQSGQSGLAFAVGTWDGQTMRLYINGVLEKELDIPNAGKIITNDQPITIGDDLDHSFQDEDFFMGTLDEIRIYKKALSLEEIKKLNPLTPPEL